MSAGRSPGLQESLLSSSLREHDRQQALDPDPVREEHAVPSSSPEEHARSAPHRYSASPLMGSPFPYMLRRRSGFQGAPHLSPYEEAEAESRPSQSFDEEVGIGPSAHCQRKTWERV